MVFHIPTLSEHCERGTLMVSGRKHFQAVSTDSQSLSRIEGIWVSLSRKWKTIPGRISPMKHDLQRPFYTLFISVPSTYFSFTVCGKGGKKWFLIESGQPNEKMGVQDITNQGNGTGQAKTDVLKSAIRFGLNLMKSQHSPLQNKKTKTKTKKNKKKPVKHTRWTGFR